IGGAGSVVDRLSENTTPRRTARAAPTSAAGVMKFSVPRSLPNTPHDVPAGREPVAWSSSYLGRRAESGLIRRPDPGTPASARTGRAASAGRGGAGTHARPPA